MVVNSSCAQLQLLILEHFVDDNVSIVIFSCWSLHLNVYQCYLKFSQGFTLPRRRRTYSYAKYLQNSVLKEFFTAALVRSKFGHLLLLRDTKLQWKPLIVNAILPSGQRYLLVDSGQNRCPISENRNDNRI